MKTLSFFVWIASLFGMIEHDSNKIVVPLGGNAWVSGAETPKVTKQGLTEWNSSKAIIHAYVRVSQPGTLKVSLLMNDLHEKASIRVTIGNESKQVWMTGAGESPASQWQIDKAGYVPIEIQGIDKAGKTFGNLESLYLSGSAITNETAWVKDNTDNYFYWGRRGPSVHLNYTLPTTHSYDWYYNEITVPEKQDVVGSYYMAIGFAEGYFGIQVNSSTERRVLFSVWSPYTTDDPARIPEDQRIRMLKKGEGVHTGEFGNEGSGGQSYLKYPWKAGQTYQFLLHGVPAADSVTTYTAYFKDTKEKNWRLVASFSRPHTKTHLKRFHSFLENFIPDTGDQSRLVEFGNQWAHTTDGQWLELTDAKFTADATARKRYRLDYQGGIRNARFYLKNCGFFNESTPINSVFSRTHTAKQPTIPFSALP